MNSQDHVATTNAALADRIVAEAKRTREQVNILMESVRGKRLPESLRDQADSLMQYLTEEELMAPTSGTPSGNSRQAVSRAGRRLV